MKITCYTCSKPITEPGALVFSPPVKSSNDMSIMTVRKYHVCNTCWNALINLMDNFDGDKMIKERKNRL